MYFRVVGLSSGTDTLVGTVTSPVHGPATAYSVVDLGRIDPHSPFAERLEQRLSAKGRPGGIDARALLE